jgi:hypothetical protein
MLDEKTKDKILKISQIANRPSPLNKRQCLQTLFIKLIQLQFGISGIKIMNTDRHHPLFIFMQEKLLQCKPLIVIVLGQTQTETINRMKIITNSSRT